MREILTELEAWLAAGRRIAVATLVEVFKSAPRQPGAVMAVNDRGEVLGSVSGGCVEAALYDEAVAILGGCQEGGQPRLLTFGISDEDAMAVGLTCGGTIRVFLERADWAPDLLPRLARAIRAEEPAALVTVTAGPGLGSKLLVTATEVYGTTGTPALDERLTVEARGMLQMGQTGVRQFGAAGESRGVAVTAFIESFAPPPRMFVFGAIDYAGAVVRIGKFLGYRVILCDARPVFATRARFPEADEIVVRWPHEYLQEAQVGPRDVICVLTHDSKFDVPVLLAALKTPAAYIGAMGSRNTHERRYRELLAAGATPEELERIASPIGLDIGGRTPEETAISIAAEIIALRYGRPGGRLKDRSGPIHVETAADARR